MFDQFSDMEEITTSIEDLFWAISQLEDHNFVHERAFEPQTPIFIQNENNTWCKIPALITKKDIIHTITWSSGDTTKCAAKHLIRTLGSQCRLASDIQLGDSVVKSDQSQVTCISNSGCGIEDTVYDLQIDSPNQLYRTHDGIVHHNTHMVTALAKILQVPFAVVDATSLSQTGYVGLDPEECLVRLYAAAEFDVQKAQRGIIFIDEIDKIGRKSGENVSTTRDVSGEGVQQALLKIIEGNEVKFSPGGGRKNPNGEFVTMDTRNVLFILGGAFDGLTQLIHARTKHKQAQVGFGAHVEDPEQDHVHQLLMPQVDTEDLIQFGMIPELIGRVPVILPFDNLDESILKRIMTEPRNAIWKQFQALFHLEGIQLEITDDALSAIAQQVIRTKTGARGLRRVLERILADSQYQVHTLKQQGVQRIKVTDGCVSLNEPPEYHVD